MLSNLDSHFEEFLEDSEESEVFTVADRAHSEREVEACKQYYEELLRSAERGRAQLSSIVFSTGSVIMEEGGERMPLKAS